MRALYTALFYLAIPIVLIRLFWRGRRNPAYRQRISERFGLYHNGTATVQPSIAWIHAVSVGEVESAIPLIRELRRLRPESHVLFTTTTPTGSARIQAMLGNNVRHCYLPYDLPVSINRFLRHFRPQIAIMFETEIWPNLFAACASRSVPLFIVNGRLSLRSVKGYRRLGPLVNETLAHVTGIAAQTEEDARRFVSIGASPDRVTHAGNIKFDLDLPENSLKQGVRDREHLFGDRPVLIAASTHEGEESLMLSIDLALRNRFPQLMLILVPRHPERFPDVEALCRSRGYAVVLRTAGRACTRDDQIFLVDTMGELKRFYATADVAFVGGSLVPIGGHNVLEPAALGIPVLFGPHVDNFREICSALTAAGGSLACEDETAVVRHTESLLADAKLRVTMGACGRSFVATNRGALGRIVSLIEPYMRAATAPPCPASASDSSSKAAGRPIK